MMIGPMAAGKTTVGREIARWLGVEFIDSDQFIENLHREKISEIFQKKGEAEFREIEAFAIDHLLTYFPGVLALGGGAVTRESTREKLKHHRVMWLKVELENIEERIIRNKRRPLLQVENPGQKWQEIADARAEFFEEVSSHVIKPSNQPPRQVAQAIVDQMKLPELVFKRKRVSTTVPKIVNENFSAGQILNSLDAVQIEVGKQNPYKIAIGRNLTEAIVNSIPKKVQKVLIIHQGAVHERAEILRNRLLASGKEAYLAEIPDGEAAKSAKVLEFIWQILGQTNFSRSDLIIGFGGGAATDLAGFAAASWLRGIAAIQLPSTVAAMVDAAIGGKTGINTAEGKNLVGAFYPPIAVYADLDLLQSLSQFDIAAGLAEVVKAGFIADPKILEIFEKAPEKTLDPRSEEFREVMIRAIKVKASVVSEDLTEQGLREILNYGHTFAHAIEHLERYQWRHGAAVSVGMVYAAKLALLSGKIDEQLFERHRSILSSLGLPITYRQGVWEQLLVAMKRDKKTKSGLLRFVILTKAGNTTRLEGPDPNLLYAAYEEITT